MKKIDTHGLKMVGLKKACGNTCDCGYSGLHTEIFYDPSDGQVWAKLQLPNSWTEYMDRRIVWFSTAEHMTMQEIADKIAWLVAYRKECDAMYRPKKDPGADDFPLDVYPQ